MGTDDELESVCDYTPHIVRRGSCLCPAVNKRGSISGSTLENNQSSTLDFAMLSSLGSPMLNQSSLGSPMLSSTLDVQEQPTYPWNNSMEQVRFPAKIEFVEPEESEIICHGRPTSTTCSTASKQRLPVNVPAINSSTRLQPNVRLPTNVKMNSTAVVAKAKSTHHARRYTMDNFAEQLASLAMQEDCLTSNMETTSQTTDKKKRRKKRGTAVKDAAELASVPAKYKKNAAVFHYTLRKAKRASVVNGESLENNFIRIFEENMDKDEQIAREQAGADSEARAAFA